MVGVAANFQPTSSEMFYLVKKICFISRAVSILSTTLHLHQLNTADIAFSLHAQRMSSAQLRIEKFRKQNERTDDRCSRSIKVIVRRVLTQNCHQRNIYIKLCSHEQQTHTHTNLREGSVDSCCMNCSDMPHTECIGCIENSSHQCTNEFLSTRMSRECINHASKWCGYRASMAISIRRRMDGSVREKPDGTMEQRQRGKRVREEVHCQASSPPHTHETHWISCASRKKMK